MSKTSLIEAVKQFDLEQVRKDLRKNPELVAFVATCSYNLEMTAVGIRELKNNLSEYVRRIEKGEKFAITAHGRIVAELLPPGKGRRQKSMSRYEELVAAGLIRPALEEGDPIPDDGMRICLPAGTVQELIDWGRGED